MKGSLLAIIIVLSAVAGGLVGAVITRNMEVRLPAEASFEKITVKEIDAEIVDLDQLTARDENGELFVHLQNGILQVHRMIKAGELRGRVVLGQSVAACQDPINAPISGAKITAELATTPQGAGALIVRSPQAVVQPGKKRPDAGQAVCIAPDSKGVPSIYVQSYLPDKTNVNFIYHPDLVAKAREAQQKRAAGSEANPDGK